MDRYVGGQNHDLVPDRLLVVERRESVNASHDHVLDPVRDQVRDRSLAQSPGAGHVHEAVLRDVDVAGSEEVAAVTHQ